MKIKTHSKSLDYLYYFTFKVRGTHTIKLTRWQAGTRISKENLCHQPQYFLCIRHYFQHTKPFKNSLKVLFYINQKKLNESFLSVLLYFRDIHAVALACLQVFSPRHCTALSLTEQVLFVSVIDRETDWVIDSISLRVLGRVLQQNPTRSSHDLTWLLPPCSPGSELPEDCTPCWCQHTALVTLCFQVA